MRGVLMREYEIRVLNHDHTLSLSMRVQELNNSCAIREGLMIAQGKQFEVWRGDDRIHCNPAALPDAPFPFLRVGRH